MRFTDNEYEKYNGTRMFGKIRTYFYDKGYGYIRTETGSDIFVSSWNFEGKSEKKLYLFSTVRFTPARKKDGRYYAANVELLERYPEGRLLTLPGGKEVPVKWLLDINYREGDKNDPYHEELGVYDAIILVDKFGMDYIVTGKDCPYQLDGKVDDLPAYYKQLERRFSLW